MLPAKRLALLGLLALLAVLAYLPTLRQPLLEDDYPNLAQAQTYGAPGAWRELAGSVFRLRATSEWLMNFAYDAFGLHPAPYYAISILLHIGCTWMVYALGIWPVIGYRVSAWAAVFFAVYEGHQEAVMWFSACNELLQFLFGVGAIVCWLHFGKSGRRGWLLLMWVSVALALISKESAAVIVLLGALTEEGVFRDGGRLRHILPGAKRSPGRDFPRLIAAVPAILLAGAAVLSVYVTRDNSFRFQDGSFSLRAPFWRTLPENFARLFWFWGLLALPFAWTRYRAVAIRGLLWAGIGLLPYCFLTYSARIPSRQLYLASAGLALVAGAGLAALEERRRALTAAVCAVLLIHNTGYLWIRKRAQFLERAAPTEQLIAFARRTPGPIYIQCFPRPGLIAQEAVHLGAGKPESDIILDSGTAKSRGAAAFCYDPVTRF